MYIKGLREQLMTRTIQARCVFAGALGALAMLVAASTARADTIVTIDVSAGAHSNSWSQNVVIATDPFTWTLPSSVEIYSTSAPFPLLATINTLNLTLEVDPQVLLGFFVTAGAVDTNFTISSGVVNFPTLTNPESFASAGVTVTDANSNGASITGAFPGSKIYEAQYNNAGSVFADLVSTVSIVPPQFIGVGSEQFPLIGTTPIAGSVFNIQSQFSFTLTAGDLASGTSQFTVIPEPSTVVLALMGGAALLWRARRRR
jgi:hypothetical protein